MVWVKDILLQDATGDVSADYIYIIILKCRIAQDKGVFKCRMVWEKKQRGSQIQDGLGSARESSAKA